MAWLEGGSSFTSELTNPTGYYGSCYMHEVYTTRETFDESNAYKQASDGSASFPIASSVTDFTNLFASLTGALMYFATLTEVPILEGLLQNGMGKGPALALLLAGPALSLPNMLVINSVIGLRKTLVFVILVVIMASITGLLYGTFF